MLSMQCNVELGTKTAFAMGPRKITFSPPPPRKLIFTIFLCAYNLDKHQTVYNTCGRNERTYEQICIPIYIYICDSLVIGKFGSLL
jgi:hypothetical protein